MPRRPRISLPNVPQHIIQRGNNRAVCFYAEEDYTKYLKWLEEYADKTNCHIHAYVLMTNHVHLLVSTEQSEAIGVMMKALGQRYIELNPIRASMVEHPAEYRWSSYRSNAQGELSDLIKPHVIYEQLGLKEEARQAAYRELFRY